MDLTIALEHRFMRTPDGAIWTATGLARRSWSRYLLAFRRVRLLARVRDVPAADPRWPRVDGDRVEIEPVPYFVGPRAYLQHRGAVHRAIAAALAARPDDAVILRVPGTIGGAAAPALRAAGRPYGVEVVGDPHDVFAPGAVAHPLRPLFRWWFASELRSVCATAAASLYVTSAALQRRYPPAAIAGASFAASDVELGDEAFVAAPRDRGWPAGPPFRVVTVGTLEELYKSPGVLIRALARACADGLDAELAVVGGGRHQGELEALAARLGIRDRVRFRGQLPSGAAVRRELDQAHLFALSSRAEGMPRAVIEAMARGLPCLATPVGGIPELLPPSQLVAREPAPMAARLREIAASALLRGGMSAENLARAHAFEERALEPVREAFYRRLQEATGGAHPRAVPARAVDAGARTPA